jgi:hypothetical protein
MVTELKSQNKFFNDESLFGEFDFKRQTRWIFETRK